MQDNSKAAQSAAQNERSHSASRDHYSSFMVRIWRSDDSWRAAVIDPHSDKRTLFATRQQLLDFMSAQMGGPDCATPQKTDST